MGYNATHHICTINVFIAYGFCILDIFKGVILVTEMLNESNLDIYYGKLTKIVREIICNTNNWYNIQ